jgi:hypothetical protein
MNIDLCHPAYEQGADKGKGSALALRDLFIDSDSAGDVQAYILRPDGALALSRQIICRTDRLSSYP